MWKCTECNYVMQDSDKNCSGCGCPHPNSDEYESFISKNRSTSTKPVGAKALEKEIAQPKGSRLVDEAIYRKKRELLSSYGIKVSPDDVSSEQYEELVKLKDVASNKDEERPFSISDALSAIGCLCFIVFAIVGYALGNQYNAITDEFSWATAFSIWTTGLFNGMLFISLGRIIELLTEIRSK